jgi:hypothetical protein
MILRVSAPGMPWLDFEWHPGDRTLYMLRKSREGKGVTMATAFLENVTSEHEAQQGIKAFIAGYTERSNEPALYRGDGPKHHTIILDTGKVGARHGS